MVSLRKGSITVEAALLMPIWLLVIFGTFSVGFHAYYKTWLTCAAYEAAVSGSIKECNGGQGEETAQEKAKLLADQVYYGIRVPDIKTEERKESCTVKYLTETTASFWGLSWKLEAVGKSEMINPSQKLRFFKNLKEVGGMLGVEE